MKTLSISLNVDRIVYFQSTNKLEYRRFALSQEGLTVALEDAHVQYWLQDVQATLDKKISNCLTRQTSDQYIAWITRF